MLHASDDSPHVFIGVVLSRFFFGGIGIFLCSYPGSISNELLSVDVSRL